MRNSEPSLHQQDIALANALASAYRDADNEDRLIFPTEVLTLLDAFQQLWPYYRPLVWPGLYDQIAVSLQPGLDATYEDPADAAQAMAALMIRLHAEFEARAHDPGELLRYARRVRLFHSNVSGCARAVARVLQALLAVRQAPAKPLRRLIHHLRIVRPLQRQDGLLSGLEGHFTATLAALAAGERPIVVH